MVTVGGVVRLDFRRVPIVPNRLDGTSSKLIEDLSKHEHCAEELRELADNHWLLYAISHRSRCRPCLPRRLPRCWLVRALSRTEHRTGGSRDSRHRLVGPWN